MTPVSTPEIKLTKSQAGDTQSSEPKKNEKDIFSNLKVHIVVDNPDVDGKINHKAEIKLSLTGQFRRGEKNKKINLEKRYYRFDQETHEDYLVKNELWNFSLKTSDRSMRFDVLCKTKWECDTVILNAYWYDANKALTFKQFHVVSTIKSNENTTTIDENQAEAQELTQVADSETIVEDEPVATRVSGYNLTSFRLDRDNEFITSEVKQEDEDNEESQNSDTDSIQTVDQIDRDVVELRTVSNSQPLSVGSLPLVDNGHVLERDNIYFDFLTDNIESYYANELPLQALGCPGVYVNQYINCQTGGTLKNADQLKEIYVNEITKGEVPYALKTSARNQFYGTRAIVNLMESVAQSVFEQTGKTAVYGDISQKHGGKFPILVDGNGDKIKNSRGEYVREHRSHQNGLDIDVMFFTNNNDHRYSVLSDRNFENFDIETNYLFIKELYRKAMVYHETAMGTQKYSYLITIAVDQLIKDKFCEYAKLTSPEEYNKPFSETYEVLRRIRVWSGHDDHYHIRLSCHTANCTNYSSIPEETDCSN